MRRHERDRVQRSQTASRPSRAAPRPRDGARPRRTRSPYASQRELVMWSLVAVPDAGEAQGASNAKET
jgi:hypothetical protein